jgi:hypothetical protein
MRRFIGRRLLGQRGLLAESFGHGPLQLRIVQEDGAAAVIDVALVEGRMSLVPTGGPREPARGASGEASL